MFDPRSLFHGRLDRAGVVLSALCLVHCVSGVVLAALLGVGGTVLFDPRIHEYGLAAALLIGAVGLGVGVARHGRKRLLVLGACGLAMMALGLLVPHGVGEAALTMLGVTLLASAHLRNLRHAH